MPIRINLKEHFGSDSQEVTIDKVNFNFNKLLELGVGLPGPIGITGPLGSAGPTGQTGPEGERGNIWFVGNVDPNTETFTDLKDGDFYLQNDTSQIWQYFADTDSWIIQVDLEGVVQDYLSLAGTSFVRGLGTNSPDDSRYIVFPNRGNNVGDSASDILGGASNNDILFLNNFNEKFQSEVIAIDNFPLDTNTLYNALQKIYADVSSGVPGRYHLELGSLFTDTAGIMGGGANMSALKHNLKLSHSISDVSGGPTYPNSNDYVYVGNFSMTKPVTEVVSELDYNSIFEFNSPKYNNEGGSQVYQGDFQVRLGSKEGLGEFANYIESDGIHFQLGTINASIGIAFNLQHVIDEFNNENYFIIDSDADIKGALINKTLYQDGGNIEQLGSTVPNLSTPVPNGDPLGLATMNNDEIYGNIGIVIVGNNIWTVDGSASHAASTPLTFNHEGAIRQLNISDSDSPIASKHRIGPNTYGPDINIVSGYALCDVASNGQDIFAINNQVYEDGIHEPDGNRSGGTFLFHSRVTNFQVFENTENINGAAVPGDFITRTALIQQSYFNDGDWARESNIGYWEGSANNHHRLSAGDLITVVSKTVSAGDFVGTHRVISTPSTTTFQFTNIGADVGSISGGNIDTGVTFTDIFSYKTGYDGTLDGAWRVKLYGNNAIIATNKLKYWNDDLPELNHFAGEILSRSGNITSVDISSKYSPVVKGAASDFSVHHLDMDIIDRYAATLSLEMGTFDTDDSSYDGFNVKVRLYDLDDPNNPDQESISSSIFTSSDTINSTSRLDPEVFNRFGSISTNNSKIYAMYKNGLFIFNLQSISSPIESITYTNSDRSSLDSKIVGDNLYILSANYGSDSYNPEYTYITKVRIKDPNNISIVWEKRLSGNHKASRFEIVGNNIYVPDSNIGRNELLPIEIDGIETDHMNVGNLKVTDVNISNDLTIGRGASISKHLTVGDGGITTSGRLGLSGIPKINDKSRLQIYQHGKVPDASLLNDIDDYNYTPISIGAVPYDDTSTSFKYSNMIKMYGSAAGSLTGTRRQGILFQLGTNEVFGTNKSGAITVESNNGFANSPDMKLYVGNNVILKLNNTSDPSKNDNSVLSNYNDNGRALLIKGKHTNGYSNYIALETLASGTFAGGNGGWIGYGSNGGQEMRIWNRAGALGTGSGITIEAINPRINITSNCISTTNPNLLIHSTGNKSLIGFDNTATGAYDGTSNGGFVGFASSNRDFWLKSIEGDSAIRLEAAGGVLIEGSGSSSFIRVNGSGGEIDLWSKFSTTTNSGVAVRFDSFWRRLRRGNVGGAENAYFSSDERLKTNITPNSGTLDSILNINIIDFNWNNIGLDRSIEHINSVTADDDCSDEISNKLSDWRKRITDETESIQTGAIAQEIRDIFPNIVNQDVDDEYLTINYGKMVPHLIKGIQELHTIVEEKDAKIKSLEDRLAIIETHLGL